MYCVDSLNSARGSAVSVISLTRETLATHDAQSEVQSRSNVGMSRANAMTFTDDTMRRRDNRGRSPLLPKVSVIQSISPSHSPQLQSRSASVSSPAVSPRTSSSMCRAHTGVHVKSRRSSSTENSIVSACSSVNFRTRYSLSPPLPPPASPNPLGKVTLSCTSMKSRSREQLVPNTDKVIDSAIRSVSHDVQNLLPGTKRTPDVSASNSLDRHDGVIAGSTGFTTGAPSDGKAVRYTKLVTGHDALNGMRPLSDSCDISPNDRSRIRSTGCAETGSALPRDALPTPSFTSAFVRFFSGK